MFNFPWTNFHELNLDWILSVVKEAKEIFDSGRSDIDYAVETADEAKEIATQAAEATIPDNSVSSTKIQDGAVTTPKIQDGAVTLNKLATSVAYGITDKVLNLIDVPVFATNGNIINYTNSAITPNHVLVACSFDNPAAITTDVTWITSAGNLLFTGTSTAATTADIVLIKKDN